MTEKTKPTKKATKAEQAVLKNFMSMCSVIKNCSPAFIEHTLEELSKQELTEASKTLISTTARQVAEQAKEDSKIQLPASWEKLYI